MKNKKSLPIMRPVTRRGAGGLVAPEKNFATSWKKVLDKIWAPISKLFASPDIPIWLGPANYACYSSTIMLTSKIITQTVDNLF